MKKTNLLRFAAMLPLFVFLFTSCSKDVIPNPEPEKDSPQNSKKYVADGQSDDPNDEKGYGTIQVMVIPVEAMAVVMVYNDLITVQGFSNKYGIIIIPKLLEGTYSMKITPTNPDYHNEILIENIIVNRDEVTDLGEIKVD